jgi:cell division protein FtsI/penicillin-binding protein 2
MENVATLQAPRGTITDVNGVALAKSVNAINIVVDQSAISNPAFTAKFASPILGMPVSELQTLFTGELKWKLSNVLPLFIQNAPTSVNIHLAL